MKKLVSVSASTDKFINEGKDYDFDRYTIIKQTPMSTQEFDVVVDHINRDITGDVVRYGSWDDLDADELKELMTDVTDSGKTLRPFENYTMGY